MNDIRLCRIGGIVLTAAPSAVIASLLSWAGLAAAAHWLLGFGLAESLAGAAMALAIHWAVILVHHAGHAYAAAQVGYPIVGLRLWGVLGADQYPPGEPDLPGGIHVRRALGGPAASFTLVVLLSLLALSSRAAGELPQWLLVWAWLDSTMLAVGGLLPLGFTDGDTLLYWWRRR